MGGQRDVGPTDRNGCYMNPYMFGHKKFYGPGSDYTINTMKPFTIVTEFREKHGELDGMYQYYYQDGKKIEQPEYGFGSGNAMTDDFCKKSFEAHGEKPFFQNKGGMKQFGKAVKRGMTMVVSFWYDMATNMNWLDSGKRGVCDPKDGIQQPSGRSTLMPPLVSAMCAGDLSVPRTRRPKLSLCDLTSFVFQDNCVFQTDDCWTF